MGLVAMTTNEIVYVLGFLVSIGTLIATTTSAVRKIKEDTDNKIVQVEIASERRISQVDGAWRIRLQEIELYVRDNYVNNDVFYRMIELAAANNENQFRALTEQLNRLNDKLDAIQADQARTRALQT